MFAKVANSPEFGKVSGVCPVLGILSPIGETMCAPFRTLSLDEFVKLSLGSEEKCPKLGILAGDGAVVIGRPPRADKLRRPSIA